jgi:site-specific DNA-methyltransferase (adenine-specific)
MDKENMKIQTCKKQEKNKPGFSSPIRANGDPWKVENIFPPLSPDEYASLKESIRQIGVQVPIIADDKGDIVDGWHRERACQDLGIFCPREIRSFGSKAEKFQVAISLNCHRRHLKPSQRREIIATYLKTDPRINDTHLGEIIGVSKNTVNDVRVELERTRQIDKFNKLRGRDGKDRPVKYKRIIANTSNQTQKALEAIKYLPSSGQIIDVTTAIRRAARERNKITREERKVTPLSEGDIRLYHCRFQELQAVAGIESSTVQLVLTDIPYGQEFVEQVEDLATFAEQVLVEGGLFVTYCGQYWLHKVIEGLGKHLTYRWTNCSVWDGDATPVHIGGWKEPHARVLSKWKPILIFSKGGFPQRGQWCDVSHVTQKEKDWHPWQQPLQEIETLIRYFSDPGDLVIDPCAGSFTTAIACRNEGRKFVGCDVDESCVQKGLMRLAEGAG